jgi:serine/threonine protein kinase
MISKGDELFGRYRIEEPLGHGGMGSVFKAVDMLVGREVALKAMLPNPGGLGPEEGRVRMMAEARAMAKVRHPALPLVYDVHLDAEIPWIVMEYIAGDSLKHWLDQGKQFSDRETARIALPVAAALNALHAKRVFHRDVKPANIMVTAARDGAVLVDFGIARIAGDPSLTGQRLLGSPEYMAPERMRARGPEDDDKQAAASDLWALGVTMFYAFEGYSPFSRGADWMETRRAVLEEPLPPLHGTGPLASLIGGLLRKRPEDRPPGKSVHDALARIAGSAAPGPDLTHPVPPNPDPHAAIRVQMPPPAEAEVRLTPRQLADLIDIISKSSTETGAQRLLTLPVREVVRILKGCEPRAAAKLIEKMAASQPAVPGQILKMLTDTHAAKVFDHLSPVTAAAILAGVPHPQGLRLLRQSRSRTIADALTWSENVTAARFLTEMDDERAGRVLRHADPERVAEMLATIHKPRRDRILGWLDPQFRAIVERYLNRPG